MQAAEPGQRGEGNAVEHIVFPANGAKTLDMRMQRNERVTALTPFIKINSKHIAD